MRDPVMDDGGDARIADQHFVDAMRGGIAVESGADVGIEQRARLRQFLGEGGDDAGRKLKSVADRQRDGFGEFELEPHLVQQFRQRDVERVPDEEINAFFADFGRAKAVWKQGGAEAIHDAGQRLARG